MGNPFHSSSKLGRPRRRGHRLLLLVLLLGLTLLAAYVYLTRPERLVRLANGLLASMTGAHVDVRHAQLDLDGTIELTDLTLRIGGVDGDQGKLFTADRVVVRHDLVSLIRGRFDPQSLTFVRPTLYLTEMSPSGTFNYQLLRGHSRGASLPDKLPDIAVRGGRISFGQLDGDTYVGLGDVRLYGKLIQSEQKPNTYEYSLTQEQSDGRLGPELSGTFDLRKMMVDAELESFTFDRPQRVVLPRQLRAWWDALDLAGAVPTVKFGYDPGRDAPLYALFVLDKVSLTLPYAQLATRMTARSGRFEIAGDQITITDLIGRIGDFDYTINGNADGFSTDAPFNFTAKIVGNVPTEPRLLPGLPEQVQRIFKRYTPSGKLEAEVVLRRDTPGGQLRYVGQVDLTDARALYYRFPYPLSDVHGIFEFDEKVFRVVKMSGRGPTGAAVVVKGTITPPGDKAKVDMTIISRDAPVDDILRQALKPGQRDIIDALMDKDAYQRLTDPNDGPIMSSVQQQEWQAELALLEAQQRDLADDARALADCLKAIASLRGRLSRPLFDMGGRIATSTHMTRPPGLDQKHTTITSVELAGVNLLLRYWPYPLTATGGAVRIEGDRVVLENVTVRGLTGAVGTITGGYFRDKDSPGRLSPQVGFTCKGMPIDEVLMAAMPGQQAEWTRDFGVTGNLSGTGKVFPRDDGRIGFFVDAELADGSAKPYGGGYEIGDLTARFSFGTERATIDSAKGRHGRTTLGLSGSIDYANAPGGGSTDLVVAILDMDLGDRVLDLIPPQTPGLDRLVDLLNKYRPMGVFNADVTFKLNGKDPPKYELDVSPQWLELDVKDQRIKFQDMTGSLELSPESVQINSCAAAYDAGHIKIDGQVTLGAEPTFDLTFDGRNALLCSLSRVVLPPGLVETLEALDLKGRYHVRDGRLKIKPNDKGPRRTEFDCTLDLTDAGATVGVPVTDVNGSLTVKSSRKSDDESLSLDLEFEAKSLRVSDRLVGPLKVEAETDPQGQRLVFHYLVGTCYGGTIDGAGHVELDGTRKCQLKLTLEKVAMAPFIDPKVPFEAASDDDANTATIRAGLELETVPGDLAARSGRGRVEISNARMYNVPMILAILHLVNLTVPDTSSFDRAAAEFLVDGDVVTFESIRFESPTLEVFGTGDMAFGSRELDLNLSVRNPDEIHVGVLSPILNAFKDELIAIHVGGTLVKPEASLRSFRGIKRSWKHIFGSIKDTVDRLSPFGNRTDLTLAGPGEVEATSDQ